MSESIGRNPGPREQHGFKSEALRQFLLKVKNKFRKSPEQIAVPQGSGYGEVIMKLKGDRMDKSAKGLEDVYPRMVEYVTKDSSAEIRSWKREILEEVNKGDLRMIYALLERVFYGAEPTFGQRLNRKKREAWIPVREVCKSAREGVLKLLGQDLKYSYLVNNLPDFDVGIPHRSFDIISILPDVIRRQEGKMDNRRGDSEKDIKIRMKAAAVMKQGRFNGNVGGVKLPPPQK